MGATKIRAAQCHISRSFRLPILSIIEIVIAEARIGIETAKLSNPIKRSCAPSFIAAKVNTLPPKQAILVTISTEVIMAKFLVRFCC